uniref:Uncharacterized protein n=1 Tax=Arundo donax TaxID=35708 RepID=A0A0A9CBV5_ARUDO
MAAACTPENCTLLPTFSAEELMEIVAR